jgi:hypothetical protein
MAFAPETLAGFCVGLSEVTIGFPFLTAKVLTQNKKKWWGHSIRRYYQGFQYPLMASVSFNSLVFPLKDYLHDVHGLHYAAAGAIAGVVVSPQMFWIDTYTIRRQMSKPVGLDMFRGAKGFGMTVARESVALSTYFSSYHACREHFGSFIAGGVAGLANWTLTFAYFDTIRTRQIAQRCTISEAFAQKRLWHGFRFAAARAVLVNAFSFTVYEQVLSAIQSQTNQRPTR